MYQKTMCMLNDWCQASLNQLYDIEEFVALNKMHHLNFIHTELYRFQSSK